MKKLQILATVSMVLLSGVIGQFANAQSTSSAGIAQLEKLNKIANATTTMQFTAIVTTSPKLGGKANSYIVSGRVQKPNLIEVNVSAAPGSARDAALPATISCDGTKYTVFSAGLAKYSQETAPKDGFEPNTPEVFYFIQSVLGAGGRSALDSSEMFYPSDFYIGDDKLPDGTKRKVDVRTADVKIGNHTYIDVAQKLTGAHGVRIYHTVIDPITGMLYQSSSEAVSASGATTPIETITYRSLKLSHSALPQTQYAFVNMQNGTPYETPASPGTVAPDFTVTKPDGTPVKLTDYAGKVVVLDFWATWCGPCKKTLPDTDKLAAQYQPQGVVFMPICTWDTKAAFDKWVPAHSTWAMTFLMDPAADKEDSSIASSMYAVSGIPTQYVIGKDGKIVFRGFADSDAGEAPLIDAIKKAQAS